MIYLRPILGLSLLSDLFWIWFNIFASRIPPSLLSTVLFTGPAGLQRKEYSLMLLSPLVKTFITKTFLLVACLFNH